MSHIKVAGADVLSRTALLIPNIYKEQIINGLFHLYEHIILGELGSLDRCRAFTVEDYIFFSFRELSPAHILDFLKRIDFAKTDLDVEKRILAGEFERECDNDAEHFFRTIWQGTGYEKSPLGDIDEIAAKTTLTDVIELHRQVLQNLLLFYEKDKGMQISGFDGTIKKSVAGNSRLIGKKVVTFKKKRFNVFYFKGSMEYLFVIEKYLREKNPGKIVQVSEKREMSAFIIEEGCALPTGNHMASIKGHLLEQLSEEIEGIRKNFIDTALNELESMWFYGISWGQRCERLDKIPDEHLEDTLRWIHV